MGLPRENLLQPVSAQSCQGEAVASPVSGVAGLLPKSLSASIRKTSGGADPSNHGGVPLLGRPPGFIGQLGKRIAAGTALQGKARRSRTKRVPLGELAVFTRQLGTMLAARLTLVMALRLLGQQTRSQTLGTAIQGIGQRIEEGHSFCEAIANHPHVFNRLYVAMITGGERAGLLPEVLGRLATTLENSARLRRKVKSAVMYPIIIIVVACLVVTFLLVAVVPAFGEVFKTFGASLPAPTRFLIALGHLARYLLPVGLVATGAVAYLWFCFIATPFGRYFWDSMRLRLPVFGKIAHKACLARFARTFGSLVRSGVPLLEVMGIASKTAGNVVLEKAIRSATKDIEKGQSVSSALGKHPVVSDMIIRMIASGEQTGEMDTMVEHAADFLEEEMATSLGGLTSMIEPLLIVFLGVVMGGMVICMFLPIFKLPEIVNNMH
jgi:type IV pilus assembly protein PilC